MSKKIDFYKEWEINIPTINNPLLWYQLVVMAGVGASYVFFLLLGLNIYERQWHDIPDSFVVGLTLFAGMFIAFSLIMLIFFGRGSQTKYIVNDEGIVQQTFSGKIKKFRWLGLLSIFSNTGAGYTAAGASLLSGSRDIISAEWKDISRIEISSIRNEIELKDGWHTVMQVFTSPEEYDRVVEFVRSKVEVSEEESEKKSRTFANRIFLTLFALLFGFMLFPRLPIHYIAPFVLLTVVFALFALWSDDPKKRIFSLLLMAVPVIGSGLGLYMDGLSDMDKSGAIYAICIEIFLLGYFVWLGWSEFMQSSILSKNKELEI